MATNPLRELNRLGQSVWHDYIRRGELVSGGLKGLIDEDGLTGVTSNPSIFEKAIAGSNDYDDAIRKYAQQGLAVSEIYEQLAVEDIQTATDLFRPVYDSTAGRDGFVSIEVSPLLAHDTEGTIEEARRLFRSVGRPNVMVKIPGTKEGLPAIEQALFEGININITLLFAVERYVEVANVYVTAMERRLQDGKPIDRIASVASFFVSRIDTLIDQQLEEKLKTAKGVADRQKIENLMGKTAIANAKIAYREYKKVFLGERFKPLAANGARVQRVLWASTSTKNPKYSDVIYVENLIGKDTVNTMPTATMVAYRDHGKPRVTIEDDLESARRTFGELDELGISLPAATAKLEDDGCEAFARDYNKLVGVIDEKRKKLLEERSLDQTTTSMGPLEAPIGQTLAKLDQQEVPKRIWDRDPSVWKSEAEHQKIIKNALGWLSVPQELQEHKVGILAFVQEAKRAGFQNAVLLGMGGSSLCPEVCRETFGTAPGYLELHVLDSTVPGNIARVEMAIDVSRTLFIVSSKSGGTAETLSFFRYFYERVKAVKKDSPGGNFIAITDPGTSLEKLARSNGFRHIFPGKPDIGGRYSALSNFGMVPAALAGVDIGALLERAERMAQACGCCLPARSNPGVSLGAIMAEAARAGRDKVTLVTSPGISSFGVWLEQLIAESTGKEGKGLIPVAGEELGEPADYSNDRLFVSIQLGSEEDSERMRWLKALEAAGHPLVRIELADKLDLGQEFFRWEIATAAAGALLGIDPFDQPNVQESKDNTIRLLGEFENTGKLPSESPTLEADSMTFYSGAGTEAVKSTEASGKGSQAAEALLTAFLRQSMAGDYVVLMAYLEQTGSVAEELEAIRLKLRDRLRLATTVGFGPRFLHSTGQLHKGGPNTGLYIQLTSDDALDLPVPGEPYSFSTLKQAQALGDLQSLYAKGRRVLRIHLRKDAAAGLARLAATLDSALARVRARAA